MQFTHLHMYLHMGVTKAADLRKPLAKPLRSISTDLETIYAEQIVINNVTTQENAQFMQFTHLHMYLHMGGDESC